MKNLHMTLQEMPTAAVAFDRAFAAAGFFRGFKNAHTI
jgi:hypothetical protein